MLKIATVMFNIFFGFSAIFSTSLNATSNEVILENLMKENPRIKKIFSQIPCFLTDKDKIDIAQKYLAGRSFVLSPSMKSLPKETIEPTNHNTFFFNAEDSGTRPCEHDHIFFTPTGERLRKKLEERRKQNEEKKLLSADKKENIIINNTVLIANTMIPAEVSPSEEKKDKSSQPQSKSKKTKKKKTKPKKKVPSSMLENNSKAETLSAHSGVKQQLNPWSDSTKLLKQMREIGEK